MDLEKLFYADSSCLLALFPPATSRAPRQPRNKVISSWHGRPARGKRGSNLGDARDGHDPEDPSDPRM